MIMKFLVPILLICIYAEGQTTTHSTTTTTTTTPTTKANHHHHHGSSSPSSSPSSSSSSGSVSKVPAKELDEWDHKLAWRMIFGDPRHPWPLDQREYHDYCTRHNYKHEEEIELYNKLFDNKVVQKIGKIFAEDGQAYFKKFCDPQSAGNIKRNGNYAYMAARETKIHRDSLLEILMYIVKEPKKSSMGALMCVMNKWAGITEGAYDTDDDVKENIKNFLSKTFDKITKILEEEKKVKPEPICDLTMVKRLYEKAPKSVQLLVLKAVDTMIKA